MIKNQNRIELIDGFRGMAILSVMAYHYYVRFNGSVYASDLSPFEPVHFPFLQYGYYGVNLFFVISGFVIFQSLEKTNRLTDFLKNRWARLFPSMVLCSLVTYFFIAVADPKDKFSLFHSATRLNFLPSLTFTPVVFWNFLLGRQDVHYIDGASWSLWAEVFFYGAAGALYYLKRDSFLKRWLIITAVLQLIRLMPTPLLSWLIPFENIFVEKMYYLFFVFNLHYWIYFSLGIFVFSLYSKKAISAFEWTMMFLLVMAEIYALWVTWVKILFVLTIGLFYLFLRRPGWLKLLESPALVRIGLASYPLYLVHQYVGVMLISIICEWIGYPALNELVPLLVAALLAWLSYLIYFYYERGAIKYLRSIMGTS